MHSIYPWQQGQWELFTSMIQADSLPHALMLVGSHGIGKHVFARSLIASLICQNPHQNGSACGKCKSCQLLEAGTFPDYVHIAADDDSQSISVDEIRDIIAKLQLTRHFDTYKVALIEQAERMNINAANALLKTLEEPPEKTLIVLVTSHPLVLPATIRSRCQLVKFYPPSQSEALTWLHTIDTDVDWEPLLRVAQGAPIQAMQYHESELLDQRITVVQGFLEVFEPNNNPMQIAARLDSIPFGLCFQWIQAVILDLLRIKASENPITLENPDFYRSLLALAPRMQVPLLLEYWELLLERKRIFDNSLNRRLFTESLLIRSHKLAIKNGL